MSMLFLAVSHYEIFRRDGMDEDESIKRTHNEILKKCDEVTEGRE